ncbi:permease-like cell division protein FtsX [Dactylosporangium cerinum]
MAARAGRRPAGAGRRGRRLRPTRRRRVGVPAYGPHRRADRRDRPGAAGLPEVYCLVFETREEAWERFKQQFSDAPDLVAATKVDQLPESFRFRVAKRAEVDVVGQRVHGLNGITDYICQCPVKSR